MSAYPHRYGDTEGARQHYATACVASARVLRSEGLPERAADLEAEARHARAHRDTDHRDTDHRDTDHRDTDHRDTDQAALARPDDHDDLVPEWWR